MLIHIRRSKSAAMAHADAHGPDCSSCLRLVLPSTCSALLLCLGARLARGLGEGGELLTKTSTHSWRARLSAEQTTGIAEAEGGG